MSALMIDAGRPATVEVGESGDVLPVVSDEREHVHEWEWTRSGRVPGERGRFREYVCACDERKRVDL